MYKTGHSYDRWLGTRLESIGQTTLAAVLTVLVESHLSKSWIRIVNIGIRCLTYENSSTTFRGGALATKSFDLAIGIDLIVLEN